MTEVVSTDILAFTYSANRSIYTMKYSLKNPKHFDRAMTERIHVYTRDTE
jgi:hypothetical protein